MTHANFSQNITGFKNHQSTAPGIAGMTIRRISKNIAKIDLIMPTINFHLFIFRTMLFTSKLYIEIAFQSSLHYCTLSDHQESPITGHGALCLKTSQDQIESSEFDLSFWQIGSSSIRCFHENLDKFLYYVVKVSTIKIFKEVEHENKSGKFKR
jgi:hypothetical protein